MGPKAKLMHLPGRKEQGEIHRFSIGFLAKDNGPEDQKTY
jgi:hypothetical protein